MSKLIELLGFVFIVLYIGPREHFSRLLYGTCGLLFTMALYVMIGTHVSVV
jgi:hypothetical protein